MATVWLSSLDQQVVGCHADDIAQCLAMRAGVLLALSVGLFLAEAYSQVTVMSRSAFGSNS
jgi:hypothetical protein